MAREGISCESVRDCAVDVMIYVCVCMCVYVSWGLILQSIKEDAAAVVVIKA